MNEGNSSRCKNQVTFSPLRSRAVDCSLRSCQPTGSYQLPSRRAEKLRSPERRLGSGRLPLEDAIRTGNDGPAGWGKIPRSAGASHPSRSRGSLA